MTTVAVDRFLALHLRQGYRVVVTLKRLVPVLVCFWVISAVIPVTLQWDGHIVVAFSMITFISSIAISTIAFAKGYIKLRRHWLQVQVQDQNNSNSGNLNLRRYKKSLDNMVCVYFLVLLCYLPQGFMVGITRFCGLQESVRFTILVTSTIMNINSSLNPLVYCWRMRAIRTRVLQSFRRISTARGARE